MKSWLSPVPLLLLVATIVAQDVAVAAAAPKRAAEAATKKDEPPAKIEGMEIARGDAGFMGLQIVDGNFKLSFYDMKKKPLLPDITRAVLRWQPTYQKAEERVVLERSSDGKYLTSPRIIRPPHAFKLYMTLFKEPAPGTEAVAAENYVIDFAQSE